MKVKISQNNAQNVPSSDDIANWNDDLFMVPHATAWELIVITSIIVHIHIVCIYMVYSPSIPNLTRITLMNYGCELLYILYLVFVILHRNYSIHKNDFCTQKMPFVQLIVGIISTAPVQEVYFILNREPHFIVIYFTNLKVFLRLVHVFWYFIKKRHQCEINRTAVILYESFAINALYTCIVSCFFELLGCYGCEFDNWTIHLKDVLYFDNNYRHRIIFPTLYIGGVVLGNYSDVLMSETIAEHLCIIFTMIFGFIVRINIMLAQLISEYVNRYWKRSNFKMRLHKIHQFIAFQELSAEIQEDIREYYRVFWRRRHAIKHVHYPFFKLLPSSLKQDVFLDLSWDAMSHSHFFRNESMAMKRAISKRMHGRFMLKGDSIYDTGDLKNTFIYIVSGCVQLLSDEDEESPIVSFSAGTVISELACLLLTRSECKLRCASYCELRILEMDEFYRGMRRRSSDVRRLQTLLWNRIQFAKRLQLKKSIEMEGANVVSRPIRLVKQQWYSMCTKKPLVNKYHTSRYLDLLALSTELDLKVEVVCLTSKFPLIMDPDSSFREFCNHIVLMACLIETALIPYCAAFLREISTSIRTLFIIMDFVYVLDIYVQITTAVKVNDVVVVKFSAILLQRIKQLTFIVDVISTLPLDYIYWAKGISAHAFILLKIPRVMKIYKLIKLVIRYEAKMMNVNMIPVLLIKYFLLWIVFVYFFTCIIFMFSCLTEECYKFSWYPYNQQLCNAKAIIKPAMSSLVLVTDVLSSGVRSIYSYTVTDGLISLIIVVIGYYLISFGTAELTASEYWELHESASNKVFLQSVMNYARIHKIKTDIVASVANILKFRWAYTRDLIAADVGELIAELPAKLQERVRDEMIGAHMDRIPLFHNLDEPVKRRIVEMSLLVSYPVGALLTVQDEIISHIYIIKRGHCRVASTVPGDVERRTNLSYFTTGACFPFVEVLHTVPTFITVSAMTTVDAIVIPYRKFVEAIKADDAYDRIMLATLKSHMESHRLTLTRVTRRMDFLVSRHAQKRTNFFKYEINDANDTEAAVTNVLKRTINPHGKFYIAYEVLRCCLAIFQFMIIILQMNLLFHQWDTIQHFHICCDVLSWLDIFVRMHVHYYLANGILVTDYKSTIKYYMRHSFALDLYASSPFSTLSIDAMIKIAHPRVVKQVIMLVSRPFQLYRVFFGIYYLCNRTKFISKVNAVRIQCILFIVVILPIGSNFITLWACDINYEGIVCSMNGWDGGDIRNITEQTALTHYVYITALYMTGTPHNQYARKSNANYVFYVCFTTLSLCSTWFLMSKLIGLGLHGEYLTSQLQNDRRNFKAFAKNESIDLKLVERLLQVNEYLAQNIQSNALGEAEKRMTPQLYRQLCYNFNKSAMELNHLLHDASANTQRLLAFRFQRKFFMKDDIIIRNNDINEYIFIVKTGRIAISLAGSKMVMLGTGGMFGCLCLFGQQRQMIDAVAAMHTEVIYVKTVQLHDKLFGDELLKRRMKGYISQNLEYVEGLQSCTDMMELVSTKSRAYRFKLSGNISRIQRIQDRHMKSFKMFNNFVDVHMSALSSLFLMIYQLEALNERAGYEYFLLLYCLDAVFVTKIFFGFTLRYEDKVSGLVVRDPKKIAIRYLKNEFFLDILVVLMPELYFGAFFKKQFHKACLTMNRLLRVVYLWRHYYTFQRQNKLTHHIRWTFLVYIQLLYIQFFTNVWFYISCTPTCRTRKFVSHEPEEYVPTVNIVQSILCAYTHVLNTVTGSGLHATKPLNVNEIFITFLIVLSSIFMMVTIISGFAFIQIIDNCNLGKFTQKLANIRRYYTTLRLSPLLLTKMRKYYHFIWQVQDGEQFPKLILESHRYLREDIMLDLYGDTLMKHWIFKNTHKDFIRQLSVYIIRYIYPRSLVIVRQKHIDGKIYFIQSGEVSVVDESVSEEKTIAVLSSGESFGEMQGLKNTPHSYTYVAKTMVVILTLKNNYWAYLKRYFPASQLQIKQNIISRNAATIAQNAIKSSPALHEI